MKSYDLFIVEAAHTFLVQLTTTFSALCFSLRCVIVCFMVGIYYQLSPGVPIAAGLVRPNHIVVYLE